MPIVVKTGEGDVGTETGYRFHAMGLNMAKALSEAIGASYGIIEGSTVSGFKGMQYYVRMDSIGYPGLCVNFRTFYDNSESEICLRIEISQTKDNTPDPDDANRISFSFTGGNSITNSITSCPETCVMIHDESKDTVLFDIHHGRDLHGVDINRDNPGLFIKYTCFFAKDVRGEILCGCGAGSIIGLRTMNGKSDSFDNNILKTVPQKNLIGQDVFHLTKMVNYMDPSYPEMRSAYVAVLRPSNYSESEKRVTLLEVNGAKFGSAGNTDWAEKYKVTDSRKYYFPINPFVRY